MPNGREYGGVWVIQHNDYTHYERQYPHEEDHPKKYFIYGKGWQKVGKAKISHIPAIEPWCIKTADDVFKLIEVHGFEATGLLMGFDEQSIGDRDPLRQLRMLDKYGKPMLEWLEKIAEIDAGIKQFFENKGVSFRAAETTDVWLNKGEGNNYDCMYRCSPFVGRHITCILHGILTLERPYIDVVRLDRDWCATLRFAGIETEGMSMSEVLTLMVGSELSQWLHDNLSPEFV